MITKPKKPRGANTMNTENQKGLYRRYKVEKVNGDTDPNAEYFVLRLDEGGSDIEHIKACRIAAHAYADAIERHLPQLAADLRGRYPLIQDCYKYGGPCKYNCKGLCKESC